VAQERHRKPIEEEESYRWLQGYQLACEVQQRCPDTLVVSMADREGDIHEWFLDAVRRAPEERAEFIIRAKCNRRIGTGKTPSYLVTTNLFPPRGDCPVERIVVCCGSLPPRSGEPTMQLLRYLQHWLTGRGPRLQVADFVPETHPIRQWADTFPWAALVAAVDRSFAQRFPKPTTRGRPPVSTRVLLALELLKHELACSDEQICSRLRTDLAVMYACGITAVQVDRTQDHFVLPEVLAQFRRRLDEPLMAELLAIQAATAMEDGLVSPAHLVVDTFPSEQGSQRVNDAATLYKAQKKSSR
jgi:transposase